jgi:DNA-binding MarR family transcriptional regulator
VSGPQPQVDPSVRPDQVAPLQELSLRLVRRLRRRTLPQLTPSQMSALSTLDRIGPLRVGELARREHIGKSSITRLAAKLEDMGYLTREVDPEDGRSSVVAISPRGHELLAAARRRANEFLAAEVARLAPEDRAALLGALPSLERLVALPQRTDEGPSVDPQ